MAQHVGVDPREMKQLFREAWEQSDDAKSMKAALADKGLYFAKGDRRAHVAIDIHGMIYSLSKWAGVRAKEVKARVGDPQDSQSVAEVLDWLKSRKTDQVKDYIQQIKDKHDHEMQPLKDELAQMVTTQRGERMHVRVEQEKRWMADTKARSDRLNKGLRGLFDRLTGSHQRTIKTNEREALRCHWRDQEQRNRLIQSQMRKRQDLQTHAKTLKLKQRKDRDLLARNIATYLKRLQISVDSQHRSLARERNRRPGLDLGR